jgi:hypothetical protein
LSHSEIKQLVWDKHNNILNLWNKAIGVGQMQQHLKSVKSNNVPHQLLYFTDLRCCCVCPTPIALLHRCKMLLCLSHINCFLNLWNQTIVVGQTQEHLKSVKKTIGVGQTQQHLKPVKSNNSCGTNTRTS